MIVVDTNVFSAFMRIEKEPVVQAWLDTQRPDELRIASPTLFEIHHGISRLPDGRRRRELGLRLADVLAAVFTEKVLPLDAQAAELAGRAQTRQLAKGSNIDVPDSLIAGVALAHSASIATRDMQDFSGIGIPLVNPWA